MELLNKLRDLIDKSLNGLTWREEEGTIQYNLREAISLIDDHRKNNKKEEFAKKHNLTVKEIDDIWKEK